MNTLSDIYRLKYRPATTGKFQYCESFRHYTVKHFEYSVDGKTLVSSYKANEYPKIEPGAQVIILYKRKRPTKIFCLSDIPVTISGGDDGEILFSLNPKQKAGLAFSLTALLAVLVFAALCYF